MTFFHIWLGNKTSDVIKEDEPADVTENSVQSEGFDATCTLLCVKSPYATLDMFCLFAREGIYSM